MTPARSLQVQRRRITSTASAIWGGSWAWRAANFECVLLDQILVGRQRAEAVQIWIDFQVAEVVVPVLDPSQFSIAGQGALAWPDLHARL